MKPLAKRTRSAFPLKVVQELHTLEQDLGGREELIGMLALAPLTPELRYVLGLLGDPRYEAKPLAEICSMGNILPGELMKHLSSAALLKGKVLVHQIIGRGIQAVADDMVRRAAPYEEPCATCMVDGIATGRVVADPSPSNPNPVPEPCPDCRGSRALKHYPELSRQQAVMELAHLTPKGGGLNIVQATLQAGQQGGGTAGLGTLERLQQMTDRILYGDQGPIDGEVLTEEPQPAPPEPVEGSDA